MIFVDTSVWVAGFRGADRGLGQHLDELLDSDAVAVPVPVKVEILTGAGRRELDRLRRLLGSLPTFYPSAATWESLDRWIDVAVQTGQQFALGDLLIGAIAAEHGGEVWSLDADFRRMRKLKFVELHEP